MAIIDTFLMLFQADTSSVKKGVDASEKDLDRLAKDAKKTDIEVQKIGTSLVSVAKTFSGVIAGFVSLGAIASHFRSTLNYTSEIGNISRELNINADVVDTWGRVLQKTGGNAQSFKTVLQSLGQHYGATPSQALRLLPQFADSFSRLNKTQALIRGKQFGLDLPTILLLQQGRREVDELIKRQERLGVVTQNDVEQTRKFNAALADVSQVYEGFWRQLSRPLIPGFTKAFEYIVKHKDQVEGALIAIGLVAVTLAAPFIAANAEILIVTASIAALIKLFATLFEDIKHFIEGKASLLGVVVEGYKGKIDTVKGVVRHSIDKIKHPIDTARDIGASIKNNYANAANRNSIVHNNTIHIGKIDVVTNATDAQGISKDIGKTTYDEFSQTANYHASGVDY